jgi:23S rRNA pseudouridine955/2504/2580 synthase
LAGDDKYGDFAWNKDLAREGLKRMFLHAQTLSIEHPITRERMRFESPLPDALQTYLTRIERSTERTQNG